MKLFYAVYSVPAAGRLTAQLACRQYYSNSTVNSWFQCVQQTTLTEWRCGLTVALRLAMPVTRFESQSVPYFWFIFHKVFTRLRIRLGLGLGFAFLGLGIVLVYLAYDEPRLYIMRQLLPMVPSRQFLTVSWRLLTASWRPLTVSDGSWRLLVRPACRCLVTSLAITLTNSNQSKPSSPLTMTLTIFDKLSLILTQL